MWSKIKGMRKRQRYLPHSPCPSKKMLEAVSEFRQRTLFRYSGVDVVLSVGEARSVLVVEKLPHLLTALGLVEQVLVARRVLPPYHCECDNVDPDEISERCVWNGFATANLLPTTKRGLVETVLLDSDECNCFHHVRNDFTVCEDGEMHAHTIVEHRTNLLLASVVVIVRMEPLNAPFKCAPSKENACM